MAILDLSSKKTHCVAAFDPTGVAFAVAFQEVYGGASLCRMYLYDMKKFETVFVYYYKRVASINGNMSAHS